MNGKLTHMDPVSGPKMVDVGDKDISQREAVARGVVKVSEAVATAIKESMNPKGDVLSTAKLAGILGAKKTSDLIPLCHLLSLSFVDLQIELDTAKFIVNIEATVRTKSRTGVEMEALTAVSIAALTIYDMCKALDKTITIESIYLVSKSGGKSGDFQRSN
jgi:cyclic pyranopterin phosphate synthase